MISNLALMCPLGYFAGLTDGDLTFMCTKYCTGTQALYGVLVHFTMYMYPWENNAICWSFDWSEQILLGIHEHFVG